MDAILEKTIREAILALRWEKRGDGPDPAYFVSVESEALRLEANAASYVARFITKSITEDGDGGSDDSPSADLDKHSLEIIAGYLEDHGYTVSSPE
jgi:hypothetical protein